MIDDQKVETNINRTAGAAKQLRLSRSLFRKLAGREGFEPSIPDPKSGALPLGDRPSHETPIPGVHSVADIGSHIIKRFWTAALGENLMIFRDDFLFDHPPSLVVDRMSDVFIGSVLALFTGHRDKEPSGAMDDLQVPDHETMVEGDRDISL